MEIISPDNQNELNEKLGEINRFYRLNTLPTYDGGVGTNVLKLVRNIPNYLKNKGILSSINKKNNYFDDKVLDAFIEYNKRRNSIRLSLKEILNPKYIPAVHEAILYAITGSTPSLIALRMMLSI